MEIKEYLELRKATENDEQSISEKLCNFSMGMAGETGEIVDMVKKVVFHGHSIDDEFMEKIVKEFGDDFWYRLGILDLLGIDIGYVLQRNIDKLNSRYPEGFNTQASIKRNEKDE